MKQMAGTAVRWNAAASVVMTASQLLQLIFVAHWLTPAQFGLAAVAVSIPISLQGFCDLGLTNALVQKDTVSREGWSSAGWATLLMGTFLGAVLIASSGILEESLHLPGLAPFLVAAAFTLPIFGPAAVFQAHLQRHLNFRHLAVADMAASVAAMAAALFWAIRFRDPGALVAGQIVTVAVRFALVWALSNLRFYWRLRFADLVPLSTFGGYQLGERAIQFAGTNIDRVLVARLLGPAATGYYTMASQIALRPAALLGPFISRTLLPLLARLQNEKARLAAAYLRSLSMLGLVSAFVYSLLFGLADPLVDLVLGPKWEAVVLTLRILCVVGFLNVLGNTLDSLTLSLGRAHIGFWLNAAMLMTRLGAILLGAFYGLTGMAVALAVLMVLWIPVDLYFPRHWLNIPTHETGLAGGWAILPGLLTAAALAAISSRLALHPLPELIVLGILGVLLFACSAWLLHRRRLMAAVREAVEKFRFVPAPTV